CRGRRQEAPHPHRAVRGAVRLRTLAERVPRGAAHGLLRARGPASPARRARRPHVPDLAPRTSGARPGRACPALHATGDAVMSPGKPPRALEYPIDLPTDPDPVWRLLTDPAALAEWFAPRVEGSGEPGGTLSLSWTPEMSWKTRVAVSQRGRL